MRYQILIFILIINGLVLRGQTSKEPEGGTISFITSQNVYVKFNTTRNITIGDTLFMQQDGIVVPVLVVKNLSSSSCVCIPISTLALKLSDQVFTNKKTVEPEVKENIAAETIPPPPDQKKDTLSKEGTPQKKLQQAIDGRFSVSSYLNFSNTPAGNSQRMRYTFSLNARNIARTKLSGECYISFSHRSGHWQDIQDNIFNGLKIYNFAFVYDFNESTSLWLGRKINPKLSSLGANDGLQFEKRFRSISIGAVAGFRPDYQDYSFNADLFQFGVYVGHDYKNANGNMQTTLAFIDQTNAGNTDRRFVYLQHSNSLIKKIYFMGSVEFDLYQKVNDQKSNIFNLSNAYLMLRYRIIKQLSVSVTYSSRNNVIYYETYKDIVERLMETTSLQGFMLQINSNPIKNLSVGVKAGYRSRKQDPRPSKNIDGYITYSNIPVLKISATVSATFLESSYNSGKIYSAGISRDIVRGKLSGGLSYRYVDYSFYNNETSIVQNMAEAYLTWNIYKKLFLSVNYEGTFEKTNTFNHVYINLTQRF